MAFQKNIPLEEAIAPEARDQAFGEKNIEEKDSKKVFLVIHKSEMI